MKKFYFYILLQVACTFCFSIYAGNYSKQAQVKDRLECFLSNPKLKRYHCKAPPPKVCPVNIIDMSRMQDFNYMVKARGLYDKYCQRCHDERGLGRGADGLNLELATPPDLHCIRSSACEVLDRDAYIFWTISEGGKPTGSEMPMFKGVLSKQEIFMIMAILRLL
ncbi:MAG: c-type cytochrome [Bacteriovoracaceae bacterium]|nr:c-type cytochrome [Bacteriovoracaceae bacterium]